LGANWGGVPPPPPRGGGGGVEKFFLGTLEKYST